jgi:hypothetical protein
MDTDKRYAHAYEDLYSAGGFSDQVKLLETENAALKAKIEVANSEIASLNMQTSVELMDQYQSVMCHNAMLVEAAKMVVKSPYTGSGIDFIKALKRTSKALNATSDNCQKWLNEQKEQQLDKVKPIQAHDLRETARILTQVQGEKPKPP